MLLLLNITQYQKDLLLYRYIMNQSYTRTLLYSIADKIGRKREEMDKFIRVLEQNWYDSKAAIASMTHADFQKFQIPERLVQLINEEVGNRPAKHPNEKMDIESPADDYLRSLSRQTSQQSFQEKIEMLNKIFTNIRENLIDEKYRVLKKSNAKIAQLTQSNHVIKFLQIGGFNQVSPGFVMQKVNIAAIDECLDTISKFMPKIQFNPYESHISSIGDTNTSSYEGDSSVAFNQKLASLQAERDKMMSRPIKDRDIKIFQIEQANLNKFDQQFNEDKQINEDERLYLQSMKQILKKQGEEGKFMNRRKQEYLDLVKKPCFTQTIIRIKMPDNWIFECVCTPLETLQTLLDIFNECLQNKQLDYYLYMTPPVQRLSGLLLRKTFYELGCVPRAIFYFKTEQTLKGNLFKIKKTNKFNL